MAVKIRLTRMGDKKTPFYRIVVADSRKARDGQYVDQIGTFNPLTKPEEIKVDTAKAEAWLKNGAQPTDTAKALLIKANVKMPEKKAKAKKAEAKKAEPKAPVKVEETKAPAKKTTAKKPATEKKTTAKKTTKAE